MAKHGAEHQLAVVNQQTEREPSRAGADYQPRSWKREESSAELSAFEVESGIGTSQRAFSREHDVTRTTLQYWLERKTLVAATPACVEFFERPEGVVCLHRLVVALHFGWGFWVRAACA